jgi:MFS family permease
MPTLHQLAGFAFMSESEAQPVHPVGAPIQARTFEALRHPGFRQFYVGQGISLIGTWLQAAAVRWLVYEQTRSEYLLGVVEVAALMPGLVVGLLAGAIADRVTPLKMILLMECGQMVLALLLAALVATGAAPIWQMAAILALTRICVTFELPSRQVFFYELVGPETLPNAIALSSGLFNATRVIGPALAGVCLTYLGAAGCFALNGLSYVAAIAAVLSIQLERPERTQPHANFTAREVLGGLQHLKRDRRILSIFLLVTFFGLVGMGYEAMVPAYTRRVVKAGVSGYGLLMSCGGIGATLGAVFVASLGKHGRRDRWVILGMLIFAGFLAGAALIPAWADSYGATELRLWTAAACLLGAGFGAVVFYASAQTIIQLAAPDHLRGRIMGVWMIVFSGSVPLGALWTGRAAVRFGVDTIMAISAGLCVIVGLVLLGSGVLSPRYALRPRPLSVRRQPPTGIAESSPETGVSAIGEQDVPV